MTTYFYIVGYRGVGPVASGNIEAASSLDAFLAVTDAHPPDARISVMKASERPQTPAQLEAREQVHPHTT